MISIILSAGMGTRLRPLTEEIPKPLLKINEITLLERMIQNCVNVGISDFILIVGHKKEKVISFRVELEEKYDVKIKILENREYANTNTSVSVYIAIDYIKADDFLIINGDNVVDSKIIEKIYSSPHSAMIIDNEKILTEESFKVIIDKGMIKEIGKEINIDKSSGEFIGVSKVVKKDACEFNKILLDLIHKNRQNYYDLAFKTLSEKSKIDFITTDGLKWSEIDDFNDFKYAQNIIEEFER